MEDIKMTDQKAQYAQLKPELDEAFSAAMESMGQEGNLQAARLASSVAEYLGVRHVAPYANANDALTIALLALELPAGAEVIVPAFNDAAGVRVLLQLGLKPVFADVLPDTYMLDPAAAESAITPATAALLPVHLFGQCAPMHELMKLAGRHNLRVVEDTVQSLGAVYITPDGQEVKAGSMGHVIITSFVPAKPLYGAGEGGAVITNDAAMMDNISKINSKEQPANFGEEIIRITSPLETLQAAMLEVKIKYLDNYYAGRQEVARFYDNAFAETELVQAPHRAPYSSHIYHQYAITVNPALRDGLQAHLREHHIPSVVYYPQPLHLQEAFTHLHDGAIKLPVSEKLSRSVLSLPMHASLKEDQLIYICQHVLDYIKHHS